jgi:hypothetical protein
MHYLCCTPASLAHYMLHPPDLLTRALPPAVHVVPVAFSVAAAGVTCAVRLGWGSGAGPLAGGSAPVRAASVHGIPQCDEPGNCRPVHEADAG